jgi:CheY-like chemotaxis protein/anti-sigma factor RsiW
LTDPAQAARLAKLLQSVENAHALLRPLLMVLFPAQPRLEPCSLNQLVQEAAHRLEPEAAASGVAMEFSLDPNLQAGGFDPGMLGEGLVCLLRSGLRHSSESRVKKLRVGTRQSGRTFQLVCQDTGRALTPEEAQRVFQLSHAQDAESLGLSVIASVAKAHGGRITVRSQEGLGNAFLLELPMSEAQPPAPPARLEGKRLLVVDDEAFLLDCLVDAMEAWGCRVTPCSQGAEAVQKLEAGSFDGIISDIRMPGLSGIQLYGWLQSNQPAMTGRILLTTGDSFDPDTRAFLERTKAPHLGKPFDLKKLKQSLLDLLA